MRRSVKHGRSDGFTFIELLVIMAVVGILGVMALQNWRTWVPRFELRQATNMAVQCIQKARLEALQRGVRTVVQGNFTNRTLIAFADVNDDFAGGTSLIFDEPAGVQTRKTDYRICRVELPGKPFTGVQFGGPVDGVGGSDAVLGFTAVTAPVVASAPAAAAVTSSSPASSSPGGSGSTGAGGVGAEPAVDTTYEHDGNVLIFEPTGATRSPGSFRFSDATNANHFEVAVTSVSGNVEVRKWLLDVDSPSGSDDFFAEGNITFSEGSAGKNIWVWYQCVETQGGEPCLG